MLFTFASWESPSWRSELLKHARAQTNGYSLQLIRFAQEQSWLGNQTVLNTSWLFFRPVRSAEDAGFVVTLPCSPPFVEDDLEVEHFTDDAPESLRSRFNSAIDQGNFARVFFLDEHEEPRHLDAIARFVLLVGAQGWAQWAQLSVEPRKSPWFTRTAAFRWNDSNDSVDTARFLATPAWTVWEQIARQRANASSDCAFARCALDWSHEEMSEQVCSWAKGSQAELETVLRSALLCQSELWTGATGFDWVIELGKMHKPWHRGTWTALGCRHSGHYWLAPGQLRDVLYRVAPNFKLAFDETLTSRHLEAARWAHRFNEKMSIRVENPTAHEKLEAALLWREWQEAHPPIN